MTIHSCFAANLKSARILKKLSQAQLAEKCNLSNGYLGDLERGKKSPSLDVIDRIAKILEIKPYELLINPEEKYSIPARNRYICDLQKDMSEKINEALSTYFKKSNRE